MQGKGNVKMVLKMRDPQGGGYQGNHPRREFSNQTLPSRTLLVNSLFKKPIYHILEKIKNGPYFKWPNKIGGDPYRRNQNLYCHYHQDRGHITENYRTLRDHLGQLTRVGKLDQFLHQPIGQFGHKGAEFHKGGSPPPARGTINVILARPGNNGTSGTGVMSVGMGCDKETDDQPSKRARVMVTPTLTFSLKDK